MAPRSDKRPFNVEFGKALRGFRIMHGYARAEDFAPEVEKLTGIKFPLDTLRRIESGRQGATVEQYTAICLTLTGSLEGMPLLGQAVRGTEGKMHDVYIASVERETRRIRKLIGSAQDGWQIF